MVEVAGVEPASVEIPHAAFPDVERQSYPRSTSPPHEAGVKAVRPARPRAAVEGHYSPDGCSMPHSLAGVKLRHAASLAMR